jgi:hypothetical protein
MINVHQNILFFRSEYTKILQEFTKRSSMVLSSRLNAQINFPWIFHESCARVLGTFTIRDWKMMRSRLHSVHAKIEIEPRSRTIARTSGRPCMDHFTSWSSTTLIIARRRLIESKPYLVAAVPRPWHRRSDPRSPDGPVIVPSLSIKSGSIILHQWITLVGDHRRGIPLIPLAAESVRPIWAMMIADTDRRADRPGPAHEGTGEN